MTLLRLLLILLRVAFVALILGAILYAVDDIAGIGSGALEHAFGVPK